MLVRVARVSLGFGLIVSLSMSALATVGSALRPEFFAANALTALDRRWLILVPLLCAALGIGWAVAQCVRRPEQAVPALEWWVRLASPLAVSPLLVALFRPSFGSEVESAWLASASRRGPSVRPD